jgi:hypothetical protein
MKITTSAAALAILACLMEQTASAELLFTSGQSCQRRDDLYSGGYFRELRGIGTTDPNSAPIVICGADFQSAKVDVAALYVTYTDRNPSQGILRSNVSCWLESWGTTFSYVSPARYGCSALGGCPSDPGSWAGSGLIALSNPLNSGNAVNLQSLSVTCRLPNAASTLSTDASYLSGYGVDSIPVP